MQQRAIPAAGTLRAGLVAGAVGAILIDAYLLAVIVGIAHATGVDGFYRYVASGAIGPSAYTSPSGVALGIALHALVSLGWGVGYAYVAARTPQVRSHPLVSGVVFGIVVLIAMQIVEVAANVFHAPDTAALVNGFVAHVAFFGLPIAYVVNRLEPATRS